MLTLVERALGVWGG